MTDPEPAGTGCEIRRCGGRPETLLHVPGCALSGGGSRAMLFQVQAHRTLAAQIRIRLIWLA